MEESQIILSDIEKVVNQIDDEKLDDLANKIVNSHHIFLAGMGRSGLMIRAFANRLMHLGLSVSVVGDINSPHTQPNDLVIIGSGSGETDSLVSLIKKANTLSLDSALITTNLSSTIGRLSNLVLVIPAQNKASEQVGKQPMGSVFEQSSLVLYDILILKLMKILNESNESMVKRHANLE
ncbi:MAG: 6-phospho-3-hexuloisomerase [Streptococcus gallolyticus]